MSKIFLQKLQQERRLLIHRQHLQTKYLLDLQRSRHKEAAVQQPPPILAATATAAAVAATTGAMGPSANDKFKTDTKSLAFAPAVTNATTVLTPPLVPKTTAVINSLIPNCSQLSTVTLVALNEIVGKCPYCEDYFTVDQLNCKIFRHAYYNTGISMKDFRLNQYALPPHLSKIECDRLRAENKLIGCGGAIEYKNGEFVKCEYDR